MTSPRRFAGSAALALALAACSGGPKVKTAPPPPPVVAAPGAELDAIEALLEAGDAKEARKRIAAGLKRDPMNASLHVLKDGVDGDPKQLLGPDNFPYTVRAGDTMTGLAERFLGNRLKAYQLSRYNGIDRPVSITPGQVLRIPGEPVRAAPSPAPRRTGPASRTPATSRPRPSPAPSAAAAPRAPVANPVAAARARAAGLAALNGGNVGGAVALLRRAAALDPGNPLIARDLGRAQRIAQTVRARR